MSRARSGNPQPLFESLELRLLFARPTGIDVSQFQGAMNWTMAKNQGISFALIRASRTDTVPDSNVSVNVPAAKAAGILVGVYHRILPFSNVNDNGAFVDPVTDANNFLASGGSYMKAGYLQPVVDVENGFGLNTTPVNGYDLSKWVLTFVNRVKAVAGVTPLIYGSSSHLSAMTTSTSNVVAAAPTLWVANWTTTTYGDPITGTGNPPTSPWSTWRFWQYSSTGTGSSYGASSAHIDLDVFNGTAAQLSALVLEPEATVTQGATGINDGSSSVNIGTITNGGSTASATFTVKNDGNTIMNLSNLTVPTGFTVTDGLVSTLLPGATDDITVRLDNSVSGVKSGQLSFTNDDPNENPFNFTISGAVNPKAPTSFSITSTTNVGASMQWTDNSDETSFLIERKTGAGGTYAQIGTTSANATTYMDSTASPGTTYFYRVRDTVSGTVNSAYATEVSTTTLANVPTGIAASDGTTNTAVHVTWSAATGASGYAIFRASTNNSATASEIGTTTANLFYDDSAVAGDTVAYYWVKSINSAQQASGFSSSDSGFRDTIAPSASSALYNNDALPQKIEVQFSENVMPSLASSDVSVQDQNDLSKPAFSPTAWSYDGATNTATFTFGSQLIDSYYRATIAAGNVRDAANNAMLADVTADFVQLAADGNHSHNVDIQDFNIVAANFGKTGRTFSQGNYDYSADGTIGITDFNILASNFGRSISAPAGTQSVSQPAGTTTVVAQSTGSKTEETSASASLLEDAGLL